MKAQALAITVEGGMFLVGLLLLIEHLIAPYMYGVGTLFVSEVLIFFGLLMAFGEVFNMNFKTAFIISIISIAFTTVLTLLLS